jgi:hypothetical protein
MSIDVVRNFFLWCAVINYLVLVVWFLLLVLPHQWLYRFWGKWFPLTAERFDAISFAGMALYKMGILLFNLTPYVALRIVG